MHVNRLLLGGWGDVVDDVRRLQSGLGALPSLCACGHGSAHLSATCACCARDEQAGCTDCEGLLQGLRGKLDELVDASRTHGTHAALMTLADMYARG